MIANVIGRVNNIHLPKTQALLPLFEAIINSVDAIEERDIELSDGLIEVFVKRDQISLQVTDYEENMPHSPIKSFEIHDNGVGFTKQNFNSFNEADTRYKASKGGKGVGRFLWIKAFEKAEIESVYRNNGEFNFRSFVFSLSVQDGITDHKISSENGLNEHRTIIRLINLREEYQDYVPATAQTIANRLVEHCLEYYVLGNMPEVIIHDDEDGTIHLDDIYDDLVANNHPIEIDIKGRNFDLVHFFLRAQSGLSHHVSYCADQRLVRKDKLINKIPNLPSRLTNGDSGNEFIYAVYVSSDYLDENVNQQRTGFNILVEENELLKNEISWPEIESAVIQESKKVLKDITESIKAQKEERINEYVTEVAPEYRHIVKNHQDKLDKIPPNTSDEALDVQLYEIHKEIEIELRNEATEKLKDSRLIDPDLPIDEQFEDFSEFWQEYNDVGKSNLARYIVHRKYMLSFFEKALQLQNDGKYSKEELIHEIIFPLKKTSDDISFDEHNLWILDEKLSYHKYLSSDFPLNQVSELESDSMSRPDLLVFFDKPLAVVEEDSPYSSGIVIFEFKRPMRDGYSSEDNPIQQVFRYVEEIKSGDALDRNGRPITIPPSTPFYCYVVADLTKTLRDQARYASLVTTPDSSGYFGYNKEVGAYIEVLDFNKVLNDSKKRNHILFEKLNLPKSL